MADHFAQDDEHAISITRSIIANLNLGTVGYSSGTASAAATQSLAGGDDEPAAAPPRQWDEPLFDPREMGSIVPADPKKPFDVRKASDAYPLFSCWTSQVAAGTTAEGMGFDRTSNVKDGHRAVEACFA